MRRPHDETVAGLNRSDPAFALEVINGILEDGNQAELLTMHRRRMGPCLNKMRWTS
ncbi:hypothetical protein [Paracidovorax cattleyae]|uniref:Uncharacterized protein n=1 Tax=Paracidovorax cattleyae TaxID=80868 RepID=A0A1H0RP06_9BURK|nr:hypothetical protein [Paracidovorax cattleyae]SDP31140.1 hypothetical protein SAMN04489708_110163 [Paracidovorax cattleyae]